VYLDNAATSWPKPPAVVQAIQAYFSNIGASPARSSYRQALQAEALVFETRERLARLINAPYPTQIILTSSATESLNLAIGGLLDPGDRVVTSVTEHNSVLRPLHRLERAGKIRVNYVPCNESGVLDLEQFHEALRTPPEMVVISHASNVVGVVQPLARIAELIDPERTLLLVDAAQSIGHVPIDVQALGAVLVAFSGHKGLYGPPGTGGLYIAPGIDPRPVMVGGTGVRSDLLIQPDVVPFKYESGTLNTPGIAGLGAALAFLLERGVGAVREHGDMLTKRFAAGLQRFESVRVYGNHATNEIVPIVSFNVDAIPPARLGYILDTRYDIQLRTGLHCAAMIHEFIGSSPDGTARVSFGYFNTAEEVDCLLESIAALVSQ